MEMDIALIRIVKQDMIILTTVGIVDMAIRRKYTSIIANLMSDAAFRVSIHISLHQLFNNSNAYYKYCRRACYLK